MGTREHARRQIENSILKNGTTRQMGNPGQRLNAGWDEDYRLKALL
ncbi:MAG: hypothetical protein OXF79_01365 [Chloroflexi bacterium]|nr:hypothetical protein [Chloroflexota bacterium]